MSVSVNWRAAGEGKFEVAGALDLHTVGTLLSQGEKAFPASGAVAVDLSGVERVDSAGVALLLEWARVARRRGLRLTYFRMPPRALALARIGNAETLLPISEG